MSDTEAEFTWTNPTQTVTPTDTQVRLLNPMSLWATYPYPITGIIWGGLDPQTDYEFQVRLIRQVDGVITHFSPSRSIEFTTDPATIPVVDIDDDGDGTATLPDPGPGCVIEWELHESVDGTTWVEIADGDITTAPWTVDLSGYTFNPAYSYRVAQREVCAGTPGAWTYSSPFVGACTDPPALAGAPFDDAVFYLPGLCPPDDIVEAISEEVAHPGPAFDLFVLDGDSNVVLVSAAEGVVCAGANTPNLTVLDGGTDASIVLRVQVAHQPDDPVVLFSAAGLSIEAVADGAYWAVRAKCREAGAGTTTITGATVLTFGTWYELAVTHDVADGDLILYLDAINEVDALGTVGARTFSPDSIYAVGLPESSLITNIAVWDRVLAQSELPGYIATPSVTIDKAASQEDPTFDTSIVFDVVFSEAVTGFATGDVTLSGTAGGTLVGTVTGSGAVYTVTVTGMTTSGTVIASIAAAVCVSVSSSTANLSSTSTDNNVTWSLPNPAVIDSVTDVVLDGARGIDVSGSYAYVACFNSDRLAVVNISNPASLTVAGSVTNAQLDGAGDVVKDGSYCYVAVTTADRLTVVNVGTPGSPSITGSLTHTNLDGARSLVKDGNYCYVACSVGDRLTVVDVSTPSAPSMTGSVQNATTLNGAFDVVKDGNYCYVACLDYSGIAVVNVSTPSAPAVTGSVTHANLAGAVGIFKDGNYCYVTCSTGDRLTVVDVSTPSAPSVVGSVSTGSPAAALDDAFSVWKVGNYCYLVCQGSNRFTVVDVTNPASPSVAASLADATNLPAPRRVTFDGTRFYVACNSGLVTSVSI